MTITELKDLTELIRIRSLDLAESINNSGIYGSPETNRKLKAARDEAYEAATILRRTHEILEGIPE